MGTHNWQFLIDKYLANAISKEELDQLLHMADEQEDHAALTDVLKKHWEFAKEKSGEPGIGWDAKFAEMMEESRREVPIRKVAKIKLLYRIAAAAIICIICT